MPKFELSKDKPSGIIISQNSKSVSVTVPVGGSKSESGELKLTNQYGNSTSFSLDDHGFEVLWSALWEFVKNRQH